MRAGTNLTQFAVASRASLPSCFAHLLNLLSFPSRSYLKRKGIVVNETAVLLYGQLLTGRKYVPKANGVVELEKQWSKQVLPFAYQTVVKVMPLRPEQLHAWLVEQAEKKCLKEEILGLSILCHC